jgi:hypothetical protein
MEGSDSLAPPLPLGCHQQRNILVVDEGEKYIRGRNTMILIIFLAS